MLFDLYLRPEVGASVRRGDDEVCPHAAIPSTALRLPPLGGCTFSSTHPASPLASHTLCPHTAIRPSTSPRHHLSVEHGERFHRGFSEDRAEPVRPSVVLAPLAAPPARPTRSVGVVPLSTRNRGAARASGTRCTHGWNPRHPFWHPSRHPLDRRLLGRGTTSGRCRLRLR